MSERDCEAEGGGGDDVMRSTVAGGNAGVVDCMYNMSPCLPQRCNNHKRLKFMNFKQSIVPELIVIQCFRIRAMQFLRLVSL